MPIQQNYISKDAADKAKQLVDSALDDILKSNLAFCEIAASASEETLKKLFLDEKLDAALLKKLCTRCRDAGTAPRAVSLICLESDAGKTADWTGQEAFRQSVRGLAVSLTACAAACAAENKSLARFLYGLDAEQAERLSRIETRNAGRYVKKDSLSLRLRLQPADLEVLLEGTGEGSYCAVLGSLAVQIQPAGCLMKQKEADKAFAARTWILNTNRLLLNRDDLAAKMKTVAAGLSEAGLSFPFASYLAGYKSWTPSELHKVDNGEEWKSTRTRLHVVTSQKLLNAQLSLLALIYETLKTAEPDEQDEPFGFKAFTYTWRWFVRMRETDFSGLEETSKTKFRLLCADDLGVPLLWMQGQDPVLNPVRELLDDRYEIGGETMVRALRKDLHLVRPFGAVCSCPKCGGRMFVSHMALQPQACPWCGAK
jgi:hypothetical protein